MSTSASSGGGVLPLVMFDTNILFDGLKKDLAALNIDLVGSAGMIYGRFAPRQHHAP